MRNSMHVNPVALMLVLAGSGCHEPEPKAQGPATAKPSSAPSATANSEIATAPATPPDPERADKLHDLDDLCEAVDHDYGDGTLGDYYRGLKPRTSWGEALLAAGNESITPGRLLERAVAELSPGAKDPILEHCRKLLDYLDDVE